MIKEIKEPWEARGKKRRRNSGPHVSGEMTRLGAHKKKMYDRICHLMAVETLRKKQSCIQGGML